MEGIGGIIALLIVAGVVIQIFEHWQGFLTILAIVFALLSLWYVIWYVIHQINKSQEERRKNELWEQGREQREAQLQRESENREYQYRKAKEYESQFYEVGRIERQYECLINLASTVSSLDVVDRNSTWVKIEACCRLLKRNCASSGEHDRYWILTDELHKAAQDEIREYARQE